MSETSETQDRSKKELLVFLFLTVVLAPVVSIAFMGSYGFIVWMYQLLVGPPVL